MTILFEPDDETTEGWRASPLGWIACLFGWHFGQICTTSIKNGRKWMVCARCKTVYIRIDY